jgi:hypothetical protein
MLPNRMESMTRRLIIAVAAVAGLGVLYAAYWGGVAWLARATLDDWVAQREQGGWTVSHAEPRVSGFPGAVTVTVAAPRIEIADDESNQTRRWAGPTVVATILPWAPTRMRLTAPGRHDLTVLRGAKPRTLTVTAESLTADIPLFAAPDDQTVHAAGETLIMTAAVPPEIEKIDRIDATLTVSRRPDALPDGTADGPGKLRTGLRLALGGIVMREAQEGFDRRVDSAMIDGTLVGQIPPGRRDEALAEWRDAGGTLEISALEFVWGDVAVRGDGTWALDRDLQPEGAMSAHIRGLSEVIDAQVRLGELHPRTADMMKLALRAVTTEAADGRPGEISLPITVQDRRATVGPLPLGKLPRINWWSCRAPGECAVSLE